MMASSLLLGVRGALSASNNSRVSSICKQLGATLVVATDPSQPAWSSRGISSAILETIKATLPAVAAAGPAFTGHFYKRMFAEHPELLNVFNVTNQREGRQQKALFSSIAASAISVLETGQLPKDLLEGVHHKHCALNVQPAQYNVVGTHIIGTIVDMLNPPKAVLDAWGELYGAVAQECITRSEDLYSQTLAKTGGWVGEREFVVSKKHKENDLITRFTFTPVDQGPVASYIAGQYTTVWVQGQGWEHRQPRHYTLLDVGQSNGRDYSIAVKREAQGLVSSFLHDKVSEGDKVPLSAPYGIFHIGNADRLWTLDPSCPVVLLSAGVGITPTLSMLSSLKNESRPVLWLHAGKNGKEHAFRDYLIGTATAQGAKGTALRTGAGPPGFQRYVWYNEALSGDVKDASSQTAHYHFDGLMNLKDVEAQLPLQHRHAMYFFCGPTPWMRSVAKQLVDLGVSRSNLAFESFGPATEILP